MTCKGKLETGETERQEGRPLGSLLILRLDNLVRRRQAASQPFLSFPTSEASPLTPLKSRSKAEEKRTQMTSSSRGSLDIVAQKAAAVHLLFEQCPAGCRTRILPLCRP
jgi:hypothetical protein